jgi:antirestriction protein
MRNNNLVLNIYVANLGKYNEGQLVGEWINLPATEEEIENLFTKIGIAEIIDGGFSFGKIEIQNGCEVVYEEYAIHDYETNVEGLKISEYSNLDDLNEIAQTLTNTSNDELEVAAALIEAGYYNDNLIEAIEHLDNHTICYAEDEESLAEYIVEETYGGIENVDDSTLEVYFDMNSFASDLSYDKDLLVEELEDKEEFEDMNDLEFAEWYIDGLGSVKEIGEGLYRYFDYERYGRDIVLNGAFIASNGIAILD